MSSSVDQSQAQAKAPAPPPPPPPLPPPLSKNKQTKTSKLFLKTRSAPPGWAYQSPNPPRYVDFFEPRTGPYFLYGTLMDPKMLTEILELHHEPTFRPANVVGYACKLWGQYPAVIDGEMDAPVSGVVYNVESVDHASKLAAYETKNYQTKPCIINYTDGKEPETDHGHLFMFAGNPSDLEVGTFDLSVWLRRVGR